MGEPLNFVPGREGLFKKLFEGAIGGFVHEGDGGMEQAGIAGGG